MLPNSFRPLKMYSFFHLFLQGKIVSCIDTLMRLLCACKRMAIRAFVICKKKVILAFGVLKKIIIMALGPLLDYGLYYYDIYTDAMFSYTLANNCHWRYFSSSVGILLSSYFITVAYLRYHVLVIFES